MTSIFQYIVGGGLILFGRRLFWLFVGVVGFIFGMYLGGTILHQQGGMLQLLLGLVFGLVGAAAATFVQGLAVGVAGFIAGGLLAINLAQWLGLASAGNFAWLPFLVGGILGAILVAKMFDWALIGLSSYAGATLLAPAIPVEAGLQGWALLGLFLLGVVIQGGMLSRRR
jgi:hypothetical protein